MKTLLKKAVVCTLFLTVAQSSFGIVGYYLRSVLPGVNLIADQFISAPDNTLNSTLNGNSSFGLLADNATFTMWSNDHYLPLSVYDATSDTWSINYNLGLGQGGRLYSPTQFTNVFVGGVGPYFNETAFNTNWSPNYPNGLHLISDPIPHSGTLNTEFFNVTGRNPLDGEWVAILNELTQTYDISFYLTAEGGWVDESNNPSAAALEVGHAAWFGLGGSSDTSILPSVSSVPEPTVFTLTGLGAGLLCLYRRRK